MNISTFLTLYAISLPVFFIIDMIWLGFVARTFYRNQIGHLLGDVNWVVAVTFYFIFVSGLVFFAAMPAYERGSVVTALVLGGLFGFFTYATYDLTNLATLKDWPLAVSLVDMLWGTILGASVSAITVWCALRFLG